MRKPADNTLAKQRAAETIFKEFRGIGTFLFSVSGIINVLALTGSFYMLQIYDRALTSGSVPTLVALSVLALGLYLFQGMFDIIRSQVLVRVGARVDRKLAPLAHQVTIDMPRFGFSTTESLERGRDVDVVRSFLGSPAPSALFDLPWVPIYLIFVYLLHPLLGAITLGGACVLAVLAILSEIMSRSSASASQQAAVVRNSIADSNARNADVLKAMGFGSRAVARFSAANNEHLTLQTKTSDISGTLAAISRVLRMLLQSGILGLGAYLTIQGDLSAGAIIAASVASARALAPIDQVIGNWKAILQARHAFSRLRDTVIAMLQMQPVMPLPMPSKSLKLDKITVAAPSTGQVLLTDISFTLNAGDALGIIGPSAGGKTTLAKAITGVWPVLRGSVRIDDADLGQWNEDAFGKILGYLPQEVGLLDGTIWENISRFADRDSTAIVKAAQAAGIHEMILRMPDGYDTQVGPQGTVLSAGQRQRLGLARALYGDPFLVVMDEPNANLDAEGEQALTRAIADIRARGGIAVIIAQRPSALAGVDTLAVIQNGKLGAFGPRDQVLQPKSVSQPEVHRRPGKKEKVAVA
jgi:PrtD family type I secretion system ABC transporter